MGWDYGDRAVLLKVLGKKYLSKSKQGFKYLSKSKSTLCKFYLSKSQKVFFQIILSK